MISEQTIKDENLGHEDVIDVIQDVTGHDRISAEFIYAIEIGESSGDVIADIPDSLQSVIDNAPDGDKAIAEYLQGLLANEAISIGETNFLLDSGAFE